MSGPCNLQKWKHSDSCESHTICMKQAVRKAVKQQNDACCSISVYEPLCCNCTIRRIFLKKIGKLRSNYLDDICEYTFCIYFENNSLEKFKIFVKILSSARLLLQNLCCQKSAALTRRIACAFYCFLCKFLVTSTVGCGKLFMWIGHVFGAASYNIYSRRGCSMFSYASVWVPASFETRRASSRDPISINQELRFWQ